MEGFIKHQSPIQATEHACILRMARKLIISKITKASQRSKTNAYKNNYTTK
jgi:hypothetical protein